MSATGRSDVREDADTYPTPHWCTHRLLDEVEIPGGHWCDPCAGDGAILRAVAERRRDVIWTALELRTSCGPKLNALDARVAVGDALTAPSWCLRSAQLEAIVTNPPYVLAETFLEHALASAPVVAFLLRLDFLGSERRSRFLHRTPPDVHVLPNRPSFVRGKTDNCEYAWFVWRADRDRRYGRVNVLATTPREIRLNREEVRHV